MASFMFDQVLLAAGKGSIDLETDAFKVMLINGAAPASTITALSSVSNEVSTSGTGYSRLTLTPITWSESTAGTTRWDSTMTPEWTSATFDATHAIIYDDTEGSDMPVICIDFGGTKSVSNGTFQIEFHSDGIFKIVVNV